MPIRTPSLSILLGLAVTLAACSSEPAPAAPAPEPTKAPEPAPAPEPAAAPEPEAAPEPAGEAVVHPLPGDPVAGEAVYKKSCVACHGADGKGNGGLTGADFLKDKTRLAKSNEVLFKSVSEGIQGKTAVMPAHKDLLTEEEINNALAYVRKTFGAPAP